MRTLLLVTLLSAAAFSGKAQQTAIPVEIVRQPQDVTIEEGQNLILSVDVTGTNPGFQWYRGTNKLVNYPTRELMWQNITTIDTGSYYIVVSNTVNVVTSRAASVTVIRDVTAPILLLAEENLFPSSGQSNQIFLTFSEPVARVISTNLSSSGTNLLNYSVREFGTTNLVPIIGAVVGSGTNTVRLSLGPLKRTSMYLVTVRNLADVRFNYMSGPNYASVGFYVSNALIKLDSTWAWDESGDDLGTAWRESNYDDSYWPRGRGVFAFEFDSVDFCGAAKDTTLSLGPMTYYFRFPFFVQHTSGRVTFSLVAETIDDGAVMYLNGQELRRVNMPTGPITASTPASNAREAACFPQFSPLRLAATNLVEGTNVVAIEVHQAGTDFDVVFGMRLDAFIQLPNPVQVPLSIARTSSGQILLSWSGRDGQLKVASVPQGPWLPLATNSPVLLSPDLAASFFRLDPFGP